MSQRRTSLPPPRATSLFARTVYRQLKQAGYGKAEIVAFVSELMGELTDESSGGALSGVTDVETSLPNSESFLDVIEFELRRARSIPSRDVTLICLDVDPPEWATDDVAQALHARVASLLRRGVRPTDAIARLAASRYAIMLPGSTKDSARVVAARVVRSILEPRRSNDAPPEGTRIAMRAASLVDGDTDSASALLARCLGDVPRAVEPTGRASSTIPPPLSRPERPGAMVLALGGGAARAAAHIGVLRALEANGVGVAGVAGTSAGAIVGAMALRGMSHADILERFVAFTRSDTYRQMRRRYIEYRRSAKVPRSTVEYFRNSGIAFLSTDRLAAFDDDLFGQFIEFFVGPDRDIGTLDRPFAVAATDLVTGRAVRIAHGPLHFALKASCALPGLFRPQVEADRLLVDGSTVAEVPVQVAVQLGVAAPILAVHLMRPEKDVTTFESSSEVVMRWGTIVHRELVREQLRHAHHLVTACVDQIGWLDFRRAIETAGIGERAAHAHFAGMSACTKT